MMSAQAQVAIVNASSPSQPMRERPAWYVGRKAAMVSNLLVVLCSEQATQQVVNTGTLYS